MLTVIPDVLNCSTVLAIILFESSKKLPTKYGKPQAPKETF